MPQPVAATSPASWLALKVVKELSTLVRFFLSPLFFSYERATAGLGACGITNKDTDYIAAASHLLFDNFPCVSAVIIPRHQITHCSISLTVVTWPATPITTPCVAEE
jgi:hypothetical protein